jgi:hypothetical protein
VATRDAVIPGGRKISRCLVALMLALSAIVGGGCSSSSTQVTTVWKTSEPMPARMDKIVALVVNATPTERRAAEDELVSQLPPGRGVAGYTLIGDDDLKSREKVKKIVTTSDVDGLVVVRVVAIDKTMVYHPPTYGANSPIDEYYGSYNAATPGYTETNATARTEISLYSVRDQKLLWGGAANTFNPENIRDAMRQIAKQSVKELQKQGLVTATGGDKS